MLAIWYVCLMSDANALQPGQCTFVSRQPRHMSCTQHTCARRVGCRYSLALCAHTRRACCCRRTQFVMLHCFITQPPIKPVPAAPLQPPPWQTAPHKSCWCSPCQSLVEAPSPPADSCLCCRQRARILSSSTTMNAAQQEGTQQYPGCLLKCRTPRRR